MKCKYTDPVLMTQTCYLRQGHTGVHQYSSRPDEKVMIVCDLRDRPGVPGAWNNCSVCSIQVFLSDSTLQSARMNGFEYENCLIHCLECARPKFCEITEYVPLTDLQKKEVRTALKGARKCSACGSSYLASSGVTSEVCSLCY